MSNKLANTAGYVAKDFDHLSWNPLSVKSGVENHWKFKAYKEFSLGLGGLDRDLFYNTMCLVYHRDSPLVADIDNVQIRYHKALELLGKKPTASGEFAKPIQALIEYENENALKMIYRFCSVIGDLKYKTFVALSIGYDKELMKLVDGKDVENMQKFNVALDAIMKNIEILKRDIFSKDERVADEANEEILAYARTPGYVELVAHGEMEF